MLAVGAGVGCLDIFLSPHIISLSFLSLSGRRLDIDVGRFRILGGGGGGGGGVQGHFDVMCALGF